MGEEREGGRGGRSGAEMESLIIIQAEIFRSAVDGRRVVPYGLRLPLLFPLVAASCSREYTWPSPTRGEGKHRPSHFAEAGRGTPRRRKLSHEAMQ